MELWKCAASVQTWRCRGMKLGELGRHDVGVVRRRY